ERGRRGEQRQLGAASSLSPPARIKRLHVLQAAREPDRRVEGETEDQRTEIVFLESELLEPRRQPLLRAGNVGVGIVEQDETSRAVERDRAAASQASEPGHVEGQ